MRQSCLNTRLSRLPISPIASITSTQAMASWPKAWRSISVRLRVESTRLGVPIFSTRRAMNSVG
ncbi:hypothetical protein D3C85_1598380 [compost metagenome]